MRFVVKYYATHKVCLCFSLSMIMLLFIRIQLNTLTGFYLSYYLGYHVSNIFWSTTKPSSKGPCKGTYIYRSIVTFKSSIYVSLCIVFVIQ